jgi:D-tyrosyl-tRNA(Tyr) deacylase
MRTLIQRVTEARVEVDAQVVGAIGHGLLVFAGIEPADGLADVEWLSAKIVNLRIFNDRAGTMNLSLREVAGGLLLVSQFTLHASTRKGTRPSYSRSAPAEVAEPLYEALSGALTAALGRPIARGRFGAHMLVALVNDGPVTLWLDSKSRE